MLIISLLIFCINIIDFDRKLVPHSLTLASNLESDETDKLNFFTWKTYYIKELLPVYHLIQKCIQNQFDKLQIVLLFNNNNNKIGFVNKNKHFFKTPQH